MNDDTNEPRLPLTELSLYDGKVSRPNFGDHKLKVERVEPSCGHQFVALLPTRRICVCRACKAELSAFEVLLDVARSWDNVTYNHQKLTQQREQIEELKREEQQTKARVRNARKGTERAGQVEVYFAELLRRINEATTWGQLHDVSAWSSSYNWLDGEQTKAVRDATFQARQRAEASARAPSKTKRVRVLKGGKQA